MPTFNTYSSGPYSDPKRWAETRKAVAAEMVAAGWNPKAGKFGEVLHRRALKRFRGRSQ